MPQLQPHAEMEAAETVLSKALVKSVLPPGIMTIRLMHVNFAQHAEANSCCKKDSSETINRKGACQTHSMPMARQDELHPKYVENQLLHSAKAGQKLI